MLTTDSASLEFLREVTSGAGKAIIERCLTDEELLKTEPLERMPKDHKPKNRWIGGRLKIKHEFRTRVASSLQRSVKRQLKSGVQNPGDELWMHVRPNKEEMRRWREKNKCGFGDGEDGAEEKDSETALEQCRDDADDGDSRLHGGKEEGKKCDGRVGAGHVPTANTQDT